MRSEQLVVLSCMFLFGLVLRFNFPVPLFNFQPVKAPNCKTGEYVTLVFMCQWPVKRVADKFSILHDFFFHITALLLPRFIFTTFTLTGCRRDYHKTNAIACSFSPVSPTFHARHSELARENHWHHTVDRKRP